MKYILVLFLLLSSVPAIAEDGHVLDITVGAAKKSFTAEALLADPKVKAVTIEKDDAYKKKMVYKAVPLAALLKDMNVPQDAVIEAVAKDGFVATLPADKILSPKKGGAEAFVAIEPPAAPWPKLEGKDASAGPFYIVWTHPAASGIRSEQWPYMVVALRTSVAPEKRWKEMAVDASLPENSPIRKGQALFATQCMACHKLNGAGSADVGPDLNLPSNPTEYFKKDALKKYIRDPRTVRHWPAMQMPGFDKAALSDAEIDDVIAYLEHMAGRKK